MRTSASSPHEASLSTPDLRRAFRESPIATLLSTFFGIGLTPIAPGTAGSIAGLVLGYVFARSLEIGHGTSLIASVGLLTSGLLVGGVGIPLATRAARALGTTDPGCIVIDEVAGQLLACAPLPLFAYASRAREAAFWAASFLLFRLFDVWKPGPIRGSQELPGGFGIVVDDLLAGILAALLVAAAALFYAG
jgi:phosphatidylglycerophosphatase A